MARLLQFDEQGAVTSYEKSGDTNKALGRTDVLINPDMSAVVSADHRDWFVVGGSVREMTRIEKSVRDDQLKQQQISVANRGELDPSIAIRAILSILNKRKAGTKAAIITEYKRLAGLGE